MFYNFLKREKAYVFLLIFVILFNLSLSLSDQFLEDGDLEGLLEREGLEGGEIISEEQISEIFRSNPFIAFIILFLALLFIFFIIAGIIVDIVYLYLKRKDKDPIAKTQVLETGRWNFWDICKVVIIFLFAQRVIFLAEIFLFAGAPFLEMRDNLRLMLSATLTDVIGIAAVFYFVLNERRQDAAALGLTLKRFFTNIRYGVFAYVGLIPILASVMFLTMVLFNIFEIPVEPQPIVTMLREESHMPTLIYMGFFSAFAGPIVEEIFFRGFAYSVFRKRFGIFAGIVLSAAFFAYVHANLASFFPIFCLGILLAYIYERTGSLIPSMTVHIIHNSITLFLLLFAKAVAV